MRREEKKMMLRPSAVLDGLARQATAVFLQGNAVLAAMRVAQLTPEQWRVWAIQRYKIGRSFDDLLAAGAERAAPINPALSQAFADNLRDECGIDAQGKIHPEQAHETWRQNFYHALGIETAQVAAAKNFVGTRVYQQMMARLCAKGSDPLVMAGALLFLEHSIPHEFKRVQAGRDKTFPALFVVTENDAPKVRWRKELACHYIDDHIRHDAKAHYPDLRRALACHVGDAAAMGRIKQGVDLALGAKKEFYTCLAGHLLG